MRICNMNIQCSHSVGLWSCCVRSQTNRVHPLLMFPPSLLGLYYCLLQHIMPVSGCVTSPPHDPLQTGSWNPWIWATPRISVRNTISMGFFCLFFSLSLISLDLNVSLILPFNFYYAVSPLHLCLSTVDFHLSVSLSLSHCHYLKCPSVFLIMSSNLRANGNTVGHYSRKSVYDSLIHLTWALRNYSNTDVV